LFNLTLGYDKVMERLDIQISGKIKSSNFLIWKDSLLKQIRSTNLKLITDNDFAIATQDAKALKKAEKIIEEAKIKAIAQTEEIQSLFNALDEISYQARNSRLNLERQVRAKKKRIKNELITDAIEEVHNYIAGKPKIFCQLDNSSHLQRHQYESVIKGKHKISSVENALKHLVKNQKNKIDDRNTQVLSNFALIKKIPSDDKVLFQDVNYLVALPESELQLTIDNRIVKLSEQKAQKIAADGEKELTDINNEVLHGTLNEEMNRYVISIELLSPRQDAINIAREIKNALNTSEFILDIKLTRKRDI
jgi:hypothetical protein